MSPLYLVECRSHTSGQVSSLPSKKWLHLKYPVVWPHNELNFRQRTLKNFLRCPNFALTHSSSQFHHRTTALSTALWWNSADYELAECRTLACIDNEMANAYNCVTLLGCCHRICCITCWRVTHNITFRCVG